MPPSGMNLRDSFIEGDIRHCIAICTKSLIIIENKALGILEMELMYNWKETIKCLLGVALTIPGFQRITNFFVVVPLLTSVSERWHAASLQ